MAQPTPDDANGVTLPDSPASGHLVASGKRKRDNGDDEGDGMDVDVDKVHDEGHDESQSQKPAEDTAKSRELVKAFFEVLRSFDIGPSILNRPLPLPEPAPEDEPQAKRQKSVEPPTKQTIADKVAADAYASLDAIAADISSAVKSSLFEMDAASSDPGARAMTLKSAAQINEFWDRASDLIRREKAYPKTRQEPANGEAESHTASERSEMVLSLVGYAPQERRLFSSLPLSKDVDLSDVSLPPGVSITRVIPSNPQDRTQTLGELFAPPRPLPPLQPPKQPKTQAKGNRLDFYHPHLTDSARYRGSSYFNTKLSTGYYLDYSQATPSWQTKTKQHERAQSLAGRKPSLSELEMSEMETLFRGAFSTFAPCKDDAAAVVPSSVAGRIWWQRSGKQSFQRMIEVEYYGDLQEADPVDTTPPMEVDVDESAVQDAIDNWDETVIDPSLEDIMGSKQDEQDKEADEILDEVSDLIETLASYQRIRNLTLPNSQNRQSSDPVNGDMLANAGPQPSEEEHATYYVLKAQLALIIKTLPPYAVAKLNGDQLHDLLISTKIMVHTDQYKGTMDEDEASAQARLKAQQQAAQAAQANVRPPPQRTPSVSAVPYPNQYAAAAAAAAANQYATPNRVAPPPPPQYYRPTPVPNYQQPRNLGPPAPHQPRPQPNQYTRTNGYPNQYATQLAKAQTPYGHQSLPQQYATQQRPNYGQMPQPGTPNARYTFQPNYQHQPGSPAPPNYGAYANSPAAIPARTMSPQVGNRQAFSPSPAVPQNQGFSAPTPTMASQMNRFPSGTSQTGTHSQSPGLTGYHTVIPEAQQQRILDQAKARVAAQERSTMFTDRLSQAGVSSGLTGMGVDASRLAAIRATVANQNKPQTPTPPKPGMNGTAGTAHVPYKVTPVPVPVIPTLQRKPTS
ncbi:hypothetical protein V8C42DRAFT_8847 [Trichoderma barbatum]